MLNKALPPDRCRAAFNQVLWLMETFELVGLPWDDRGRHGSIRTCCDGLYFSRIFEILSPFAAFSFQKSFSTKNLKNSPFLGLSSKTNPNTVELVKHIFFVKRGVRHVLGATSRPCRHQ
ncbi:MAG: hypothetical protein EOS26_22040 [Mesorhizobium sp.]|nr:MAG: hypothetical protein EOS26_22040 [Mesorhizobium sp.]